MIKRWLASFLIFVASLTQAGQYIYTADVGSDAGGLIQWDGNSWDILAPPGAIKYLRIAVDGTLSWEDAGAGDVVGPSSATDNAIPRYDLTTGKLIQGSGVIIDDSNNVTGVAGLTATGNITGPNVTSGADPGHTHTAYQSADGALTDISGISLTDGNIIVADGTNWVAESGATARASLGIATGSTDNALLRADGTGGATLQSSTVTADDSGNVSIPGTVASKLATITNPAGTGDELIITSGTYSAVDGIANIHFSSYQSASGAVCGGDIELMPNVAGAGAKGSDFVFSTRNDAGTTAERVRIDKDGKVGILNSDPTYQLDVTGDFRATTNAVVGGTLGVASKITMDAAGVYGVGTGYWFGSDTGFYESSSDVIRLNCGGSTIISFTAYAIRNPVDGYFSISNGGAGSSTYPTYRWYGDTDTGVGHYGADALSLIVSDCPLPTDIATEVGKRNGGLCSP